MAYCANYKGHKPFSLLHQRGNHPFSLSPQFPHFLAFHFFSLSPSPCASHKNYNMVILNPRGPAGGRHLVGGPSGLGPPDFVF